MVSRGTSVRICFGSPFSSQAALIYLQAVLYMYVLRQPRFGRILSLTRDGGGGGGRGGERKRVLQRIHHNRRIEERARERASEPASERERGGGGGEREFFNAFIVIGVLERERESPSTHSS